MQGEVAALNAQNQALSANLQDANADNAALPSAVEHGLCRARFSRAGNADDLAAQVALLVERASLLGDERDAAVVLADDRLAEIVRLSTDLQMLGDELGTVAGQYNEAEGDRGTLRTELDRTLILITARDETIVDLTNEVERLSAALAQATEQSRQAIADRDLLLEEIAKLGQHGRNAAPTRTASFRR